MALDVCPGVGLGVTKNENDAVLYQPSLFFFHFYRQNSKQNNISAAHDRQANSKNKFTWCWAEALVFFYLDT